MKTYKDSRVLSPREFSGDNYGDYGFEINGEKSAKGYTSRASAEKALQREIEKNYPR